MKAQRTIPRSDTIESYQDIFNQRGKSYSKAMSMYPNARRHEFFTLIDQLDLKQGDTLLDIPAGGAYLSNYINTDIIIHSVDDAEQFLDNKPSINNYCCDTTNTPFTDHFFDKAYSLAGSHHMPDKVAFYNEIHRVLKPKGVFAYADVAKGSDVDSFLNIFVNKYNSMGHYGEFLTINETRKDLESCNFTVIYASISKYPWEFHSQKCAIDFFRHLFRLDLATDNDIINGIETYLSPGTNKNGYFVEWQLLQFKAIA